MTDEPMGPPERRDLPERTRRVIDDLRRVEPPDDLVRTVMRQAAETPQRARMPRLVPGLAVFATAAAGVLAAIVVLPRVIDVPPGAGASPSGGLPIGATVELRVRVPEGAHPGSADAASVWLGSEATGRVIRVDAATGAVSGEVQVNEPATRAYDLWPVTDGTSVWAAGIDDRTLVEIDLSAMAVTSRWSIDTVPYRIVPDGGVLWVSDFDSGRVLEVNAGDGRVLGTFDVPSPTGIAVTGDAVYVTSYVGDLFVIDRQARTASEAGTIGGSASDLLAVDGGLLIWGLGGRPLERFDLATSAVVARSQGVTGVAVLNGQAWVVNRDGWVGRVDPVSLAPLTLLPVGPGTTDQLVAGTDRLWAYVGGADGTFVVAIRPVP